jgi:hypothetical protein
LPDSQAKQKNEKESGDEHLFAARQFEHPPTIAGFPERARGWLMENAGTRGATIDPEEPPPSVVQIRASGASEMVASEMV